MALVAGAVVGVLGAVILFGNSSGLFMRAFAQQVASGRIDLGELFDMQWKKLFHWQTLFETLDGFTVYADVKPMLTGNNLILSTGAFPGSLTEVSKQPTWFGLATFSERSNFRSAFAFPKASLKGETAYIVAGNLWSNFYGFKIMDTALYGVSSNAGMDGEATVLLANNLEDKAYNIEARYLPNNRVDFHWSGSGDMSLPAGAMTNASRLPSVAVVPSNALMHIWVASREMAAKTLQISFFEYLQTRSVLR